LLNIKEITSEKKNRVMSGPITIPVQQKIHSLVIREISHLLSRNCPMFISSPSSIQFLAEYGRDILLGDGGKQASLQQQYLLPNSEKFQSKEEIQT